MLKLTDVSEVRTASIIRAMMEAVRSSETSVIFKVTIRRYIPEDSKLHTRRRENLKSHKGKTFPLHIMKAQRKRRYSSYSSLISALDGGEWLAPSPAALYPQERPGGTHCTGGWVGPRALTFFMPLF
jgi:hypothetical protein